jgi:hypothetical protein
VTLSPHRNPASSSTPPAAISGVRQGQAPYRDSGSDDRLLIGLVLFGHDGTVAQQGSRRRRWGRAAGTVAGVAIAGGTGAGTNYLHNPLVGVSVASAGALVGFAAGLGWDRRQARLAAAQRWDAMFSDGPSPGSGGQGSPDSAWYWLSPWLAAVPFERRRRPLPPRYAGGASRPTRAWSG